MTQQGVFLESTQLDLVHAMRRWELALDLTDPLVSETQLDALTTRDPHFRQWLLSQVLKKPSLASAASNDALSSLCQCLPEYLLGLPDALAPSLSQFMHQAIQNRMLRHRFAAEVRKAKRDMLYHLAYGLSHEINNPLANISTRAQMLVSSAKSEKDKQHLGNIIDQSQRAYEMLGDLMQCAKKPRVHPTWFDAGQILKSSIDSFAQSDYCGVEWVVRTPSHPVQIYSDRDLVTTILDILIQNSLEAISLKGTIIASLNTSKLHCEFLIQDTGNGLSVENRQHAMDPFYSGRDAGRGIGLGLCKANHFAETLEGELTLEGQPHAGCAATFKLPFSIPNR